LINAVFRNTCTYDIVNEFSDAQLRNCVGGLTLSDILLYKFKYTQINTTKDSIVSFINNSNKRIDDNCNTFTKRSFESKERNIGTPFYNYILEQLIDYFNVNCNSLKKNDYIFIAIDGTNNNNHKSNVMLNMGYFDITNKIPIDLTNNGTENRNKEIKMVMNDIEANPDKYKNVVIIGDRLYFSYKFMNYLILNDIKFIIRAKGNGDNLDKKTKLKKNIKHHDIIIKLRDNIRLVRCKNTYDKIVDNTQSKKTPNKKYYIKVVNDCVLITNLMDNREYDDNKILELYRKRWEIETFFKFIKKNFKVQYMKEKDSTQYDRLFICELILIYIMKIIKYFYLKNTYGTTIDVNSYQINESLLMTGLFDVLLPLIINGTLTELEIKNYCIAYMKIINNKKDRHFPRTAKRPFAKWYLKGYSSSTRMIKILEAIETNTVNKLNKNLKLIAKNIKIIEIKIVEIKIVEK